MVSVYTAVRAVTLLSPAMSTSLSVLVPFRCPRRWGYTARDFRVRHRPRQHSPTVSRVTMSLELVTLDQWNAALAAGQVKWKTTGFLPDIFRAPWSPLYRVLWPTPGGLPPDGGGD